MWHTLSASEVALRQKDPQEFNRKVDCAFVHNYIRKKEADLDHQTHEGRETRVRAPMLRPCGAPADAHAACDQEAHAPREGRGVGDSARALELVAVAVIRQRQREEGRPVCVKVCRKVPQRRAHAAHQLLLLGGVRGRLKALIVGSGL